MTAGRPKTPIEKQMLTTKGDGRTPGNRKIEISQELEPVNRTVNGGLDKRSLPKLPANLGKRGRSVWFEIFSEGQRWLRPRSDYYLVEIVCRQYDCIDEYQKQIDLDGPIAQGYKQDMPVAHPLIKEVRACEMMIVKCLAKLGFSPTDRAHLGLAELKAQGMVNGLSKLQEEADRNRG